MTRPLFVQNSQGIADLFACIEKEGSDRVVLVQLPEQARKTLEDYFQCVPLQDLWGSTIKWVPAGLVILKGKSGKVVSAPWGESSEPSVEPIAQEGLCPGIQQTVAWLQGQGFQTTDSGDGHSNEGMECALPFPNVTMVCSPAEMAVESDRLLGLLRDRGVVVEPGSPEEPGPPRIQASYDPANGVAVIMLVNVDDKLLFPEA